MLRAVERGLDKCDKTHIYKHVCMDEKSIRRGHEYVSMLYDGDTGHVIEVEADRRAKSVDNLYTKALTEEQHNSVETVCTDMWEPFIDGAVKYFPNASHCHDLYHCVTYLNDAVDKVRKREVKEFKELRSTKYLWLKDTSPNTLPTTVGDLICWRMPTIRSRKLRKSKNSFVISFALTIMEIWRLMVCWETGWQMPYSTTLKRSTVLSLCSRDTLKASLEPWLLAPTTAKPREPTDRFKKSRPSAEDMVLPNAIG